MKKKVGRPTKYDAAFPEMLVTHMEKGLSFEAFAGAIGVTKETLYQWVNTYEEFSDAKKLGSEKCRLFWEQIALEGLNSKAGVTFNSTVWIFNMKNRFGWRDRIETENRTEITGTIEHEVSALTPEQRKTRIQELERKRLQEASDDKSKPRR